MGKTSNVLRVIDDHGELAGLADDDHAQYARADGTRAITGTQAFNAGWDVQEETADLATPGSGYRRVFGRDSGALATKDDAGNVHALAFAGGNVYALDFPTAIALTKAGAFSDSDSDADGFIGIDKTNAHLYFRHSGGTWAYLYTQAQLDAGQLDNRYFTETEHIATSAGAADAGKPIKLDADGSVDASMVNDADIDHGSIGGLADDDHAQYLKEKASGGVASEVPTHTHADADNCGQLDQDAMALSSAADASGEAVRQDEFSQEHANDGTHGAITTTGITNTGPHDHQEESSDPAAPSAGYRRTFARDSGGLFTKDSDGNVYALAWAGGEVLDLTDEPRPASWQHKDAATGSAYGDLRIEWGRDTLSTGTKAVTFQQAFSTLLEVFIQDKTAANAAYPSAMGTSGFTANGTGSDTFGWLAVGYDGR